MSSFGRTEIGNTGRHTGISADGKPEWKSGGLTIDWSTVDAKSTETTLSDGSTVKSGEKVLRYGTILAKITASGKYGPADTGAVDGRQTLTLGDVYLVDRTLFFSDPGSEQAGAIEGGRVYTGRLAAGTTVDGYIQPTLANTLAALPRVTPVKD